MPEFDWDSLKDITPDRTALPPQKSFNVYGFMAARSVTKDSATKTLDRLQHAKKLKSGKFWNAERSRWLNYYWLP